MLKEPCKICFNYLPTVAVQVSLRICTFLSAPLEFLNRLLYLFTLAFVADRVGFFSQDEAQMVGDMYTI